MPQILTADQMRTIGLAGENLWNLLTSSRENNTLEIGDSSVINSEHWHQQFTHGARELLTQLVEDF